MWKDNCPDEEDVFDDMTGIKLRTFPMTDMNAELRVAAWNVRVKDSKNKFFCCFVYAANSRKVRRILWRDLNQLKRIINDNPWVLMGDWNVSLHLEDHSEGGSSKTMDMIKFQECLENIEVEDLNSSGVHFTWVQSRQNPSSGTLKKIDRVLGNIEFMSKFNNSHALFQPHMTTDHSPAVLIIPKMMKMKHKAFRFTNFIANKPNFLNTVQDEWNIQVYGCCMYRLVQKLKALKFHLKKLSWQHENISEKEAMTLKEYNTVRRDEEKLLMQKAKIDWLISNETEDRFEGRQVADQFVKHFKNFLGRKVDVQSMDLESLNCQTVGDDDAEYMIKSVTDLEIKDALFDICGNKAPGPDGYSAKFYKSAWTVVGKEVCEAVKEIFRNGKMLEEVNATLITLVPKCHTPNGPWTEYVSGGVTFLDISSTKHKERPLRVRFKNKHRCIILK
ncbi:RNA-directed DNA polymerase, eukaryota, reverse transcriptase zinc-binding domain protein [Tanacetum coccineum]